MKSLNSDYFTRIDHLRFFAAVLVLYHHFRGKISLTGLDWTGLDWTGLDWTGLDWTGLDWTGLDWTGLVDYFVRIWLINGSSGVSLFLFLTGFLFCIISGYGQKKIRYTGFVYNRILRIFPLMVFMMFIVISVDRANSTPMDIFRILTLQLNTGHSYTGFGHNVFPTGPIWTIGVEFQFYLLFPFLALFLAKYGLRYLILLAIFMIAVRYNISIVTNKPIYWNFYHTLLGRLDQFVIGMIFAVMYKKGYFDFLYYKKYALLSSIISLIILTWLFSFKKTDSIYLYFSFTIEAICWGIIAVSYLSVSLPQIKKLDISLAKLGEISFSIYLLHLPIGQMVSKILKFQIPETVIDSLSQSTVKAIIVIICSFLTFYLIERPFMSLRVKYTS